MIPGVAALALMAVVGAPPGGVTLQERYEQGARDYWAGDAAAAHESWRRLADYDLRSPGLFYALGNASFSQGRLGEARAWYERARVLDPHDGDVRANLAAVEDTLEASNVVRVVRRGMAAGEGSFEWWYLLFTRFTPWQLAILLLVFHSLFFGALIARRFMDAGPTRTLLGWGNVPVFFAAATLAGLLAGSAYVDQRMEVAVALREPTPVREGPTPEAAVLFELPEGQLLWLTEDQAGWRRARVNDDLQGWVDKGHLMGSR